MTEGRRLSTTSFGFSLPLPALVLLRSWPAFCFSWSLADTIRGAVAAVGLVTGWGAALLLGGPRIGYLQESRAGFAVEEEKRSLHRLGSHSSGPQGTLTCRCVF